MLIDSHCHLYFDKFDEDRDAVLERMQAAGVGLAVVIGIDHESNRKACKLAQNHPELVYSAGLHPTSEFPLEVRQGLAFDARGYLAECLDADCPPVAIGECGIDLHWDTNPLVQQQAVFHSQLELAQELDLPVVVHSRSANQETMDVLEQVPGVNGILHCFNGSQELLRFALDANLEGNRWYVSFAGNVTYKKATELHQAVCQVPSNRLLVETDAPFLAPQARRGKRNEPAYVRYVMERMAELRNVEPTVLEAQLLANTRECFRLRQV